MPKAASGRGGVPGNRKNAGGDRAGAGRTGGGRGSVPRKLGGPSAKHRGQGSAGGYGAAGYGARAGQGARDGGAETPRPKKSRWNAEERIARGTSADRPRGSRVDRDGHRGARGASDDSGRPNWEPRGKDARRLVEGGRGAGGRSGGARSGSFSDRRAASEDRPRRSDAERAPRDGDRTGRQRAPRDGERTSDRDRAPRDRDRTFDRDRAPRDRDRDVDRDRPARDRSFDRDRDRAPRDRDRSVDRDRAPRDRDRSFDRDRAPRDRDRSFDRDRDRAPRDRDRDRDRAPREQKQLPPIDDPVLERLQATAVQAEDVEGLTFGDLGLGQNIVRVLSEQGADQPFAIQAATIPDVLSGRDVLARGRTGSGKTIAFGAPLVERILQGRAQRSPGERRKFGRAPEALILAPTRELALQIDRTVQPLAQSVGLFTTQLYGGVPYGRQYGALERGVDIVIGTPGRIEDLVERGKLDLSNVRTVVLDEADHMCDLGFLEPVQRLLRETPEDGQRLLFSATLDTAVASLVEEFLREPAVHEVAGEESASSTIEHRVLVIPQREKRRIVTELCSGEGPILVFVRTRAFAEELSDLLEDEDIEAVALHGDLSQPRRSRNLQRFSQGRASVLVATDVAARGIHIDDVALVIQADAPDDYKTYLHRSGRTGRAGKSGEVVTLTAPSRRRRTQELLDRAGVEAEWENLEPGASALR